MSDAHSRIIATAAKEELVPLGFRQQGRSRLWFADCGSWLNVIEFTPSRWSKSISLVNAAHWLWSGVGFMSFDFAIPSNSHAQFETKGQFTRAAIEIAKAACATAVEIEAKFPSFEAIADFVVERARSSPDRMAHSWWGYEAGIASGLVRRFEDAGHFLSGVTDERVKLHAAPLLALIDHPESFRERVNSLVMQERGRLKLEELESPPF